VDLYSKLVAHSNQAMWTLREGLLARLALEGNRVTRTESAKSDDESPMKQARQLVKQAHCQAVATAKILTKPELESLEKQEAIAPEDQLDIEKTHTAEFLAQETITPEDVEFCAKYRSSLLQLEVLLQGPDLSIHRDVEALNRQVQWGHGFLPFDQPNYELKRFVRDRLGLEAYLIPGREWSKEELEPLGQKVRQHRQQVKEILGFKVPEEEQHARNGWIFQMLCQQLGLKVTSRRKGARGGQKRYYTIDPHHYEQVMQILDRRQARQQAALDLAPPLNPAMPEDLASSQPVAPPPVLNQQDRGYYQTDQKGNLIVRISDRLKKQVKQMLQSINSLSTDLRAGVSAFYKGQIDSENELTSSTQLINKAERTSQGKSSVSKTPTTSYNPNNPKTNVTTTSPSKLAL
jgi:hypothetical protein